MVLFWLTFMSMMFDIYPVAIGADYTIRDYWITVTETEDQSEMELIVLGIAEGLTFVD